MNKLEPIEKVNMPDLIKGIEVGKTIEVHADRLASFKSTVSRLGKSIKFNYSTCIDNYYTATRTS